MTDVFAARGWPSSIRRFMNILYHKNYCDISLGGARYDGFNITRGVRQGNPLSPFLFAVVSDLVLWRLARLCPEGVIRAYADDLAVVLPDGYSQLAALEKLFHEYEHISGLKFNEAKTVFVPLNGRDAQEIRAPISAAASSWAAFDVRSSAKYLGFFLGLGKGNSSWTAALAK